MIIWMLIYWSCFSVENLAVEWLVKALIHCAYDSEETGRGPTHILPVGFSFCASEVVLKEAERGELAVAESTTVALTLLSTYWVLLNLSCSPFDLEGRASSYIPYKPLKWLSRRFDFIE